MGRCSRGISGGVERTGEEGQEGGGEEVGEVGGHCFEGKCYGRE